MGVDARSSVSFPVLRMDPRMSHPRQLDAMLVSEGHHAVVEDLGGGDPGLAIIQSE